MKVTDRDTALTTDVALSHIQSRDQIIQLGYFGSVTRANTRLRELVGVNLLRRFETPFFGQSLYMIGPAAPAILGERVKALVKRRLGSPSFVQHALSVTNVRIALTRRKDVEWKFEQQAHTTFSYRGRALEVRPDGVLQSDNGLLAIEIDLCHVSRSRFEQKLLAFDAFVKSGQCESQWEVPTFQVLTVTTGEARASSLFELLPKDCAFTFNCLTFSELNVPLVGAWR